MMVMVTPEEMATAMATRAETAMEAETETTTMETTTMETTTTETTTTAVRGPVTPGRTVPVPSSSSCRSNRPCSS